MSKEHAESADRQELELAESSRDECRSVKAEVEADNAEENGKNAVNRAAAENDQETKPEEEALARKNDQNIEFNEEGNAEEEEEDECGFCVYMKGGGCGDQFIAWERCVQECQANSEDLPQKCFEATVLLRECIARHSDYYAPILQAEKAMAEEAERPPTEDREKSPKDAEHVLVEDVAGGKSLEQYAVQDEKG